MKNYPSENIEYTISVWTHQSVASSFDSEASLTETQQRTQDSEVDQELLDLYQDIFEL